jgi:Family of unknown function (DUF6527)
MARVMAWRGRHVIRCPACQETHHLLVKPDHDRGWTFNGDMDQPTFSPSLLVTYDGADGRRVCHSYIVGGRMGFLTDCTHAMRGQTVDLPHFDGSTLEERDPDPMP